MLNNASGFRKVYIAAGYTDLRRGIDGLASIVKFNFQLDPYEKDILFLFCGRRSDRIKGLVWEGDGFLLLYKRLELGGFSWPRSDPGRRRRPCGIRRSYSVRDPLHLRTGKDQVRPRPFRQPPHPGNPLRRRQQACPHLFRSGQASKNRHPSPICTRFEHHLAGGLAPLSRTEAPRPYNWFSTAKL